MCQSSKDRNDEGKAIAYSAKISSAHSLEQFCTFSPQPRTVLRAFFFFILLKKSKFQKYMSILKNFKNTPRSPPHRATSPKCIFFFKFATRSLGKKNARGPVAPPPKRATGACRPLGGRQGPSPIYKLWPPFAAIPFVI